MKSTSVQFFCGSLAVLCLAVAGGAQQPQDPRVGLKPGLHDAGQVASHMELVASLPKPTGFFDPKLPAGEEVPPESPEEKEPSSRDTTVTGPSSPTRPRISLKFANSDLAFSGTLVFVGNFNGFNTYDIETPKKAQLFASVVCPGGQGDLSVYGHLLFMSVEETRGRVDCGTQGVPDTVSPVRFRGDRKSVV